jgi:uncharacterized protein YaiE (UPF0345 family)
MKLSLISIAAMAAGLVGLAAPAHAEFIIDIAQDGANVVATGKGAINLTGLQASSPNTFGQSLYPNIPFIGLGDEQYITQYSGFSNDSSTNLGSGGGVADSVTSGDPFFFNGSKYVPIIGLAESYVSGANLSNSATFDNTTISALGLTPGTYIFNSADDDIKFVIAGATVSAVPEPSTWLLMIAGIGGIGLMLRRAKKSVGFGFRDVSAA